jgi:N-acetylglucosamine-6-phosphate deacetylase
VISMGSANRILANARVVTPTGILEPGWVEVRDGRIHALGSGPRRDASDDLDGAWLVPGFIDVHVHGGGGFDIAHSYDDALASVAFHRKHGTTRTLLSLVAGPVEAMCAQLAWIADLTQRIGDEQGRVIGAHLEGPFLAHARCGAQNPAHLIAPDRAALRRLLDAGRGCVRSVTLAPELPGAPDLIGDVVNAGAIAALGHTETGFADAAAAFSAGASLVTHLGNAMEPMHQREPGLIGAALDHDIACELINDGEHVHPALIRLIANSNAENLVLITDAIVATGAGDGQYQLGGREVIVADGVARLLSSGALAGSTLTMDEAFRRAIVDCGLTVQQAVAGSSTNAARLLGLRDQCGAIEVGLVADFVVLDEDFRLIRVLTSK